MVRLGFTIPWTTCLRHIVAVRTTTRRRCEGRFFACPAPAAQYGFLSPYATGGISYIIPSHISYQATSLHIRMHVCMCLFLFVCNVMYVCTCVCMYVSMYLSRYICIYIYTHINHYTYTDTCTVVHVCKHIHNMCILISLHLCVHICTIFRTRACVA